MTSLCNHLQKISKCFIAGSVLLCLGITSALAEELSLEDLDFQRNQQGNALLLLNFSDQPPLPDALDTEQGLMLSFDSLFIPENLRQLYDASDFGTSISSFSLEQENEKAFIRLAIEGNFSYLIHEQENSLQLEVAERAASREADTQGGGQRFKYTGDPISLSYQNIPVRMLLKELADFLGLNLIAGENVQGQVTLQLDQVPSDQALDLILTTQKLASRQVGDVLLVAPIDELIKLEEQQYEARQSGQAMEPLVDAFIRVHFAKAEDITTFILGDKDTAPEAPPSSLGLGLLNPEATRPAPANTPSSRFLSERGHLMVDQRTNQIYIRDTAEHVERVRTIVRTLDVPIRQVMIEARIVVARSGVSDKLGVTWGASRTPESSSDYITSSSVRSVSIGNSNLATGSSTTASSGSIINFNPEAGIGVGFINANFLLDLELAALETENRSEVISRPKVITTDRVKATITSGEQIPYLGRDEDGNPVVIFHNAALRLEATPQITNDNRILMDLLINNDSKGEETSLAGYTINEDSVETQVLVNNGDTIVIGGIFTSQKLEGESKMPVLGDLPLIGSLFSRTFEEQNKVELLIFITPRLIEDAFAEISSAATEANTNTQRRFQSSRRLTTSSSSASQNADSGASQTAERQTAPPPELQQEVSEAAAQENTETSTPELPRLEFLKAQPKQRFVLQVYADSSLERVKNFIAKQDQPEAFTYFPTRYDDERWYLVIYGDYPDLETAEAAITELPPRLQRLQPWGRSYKVIHRLIQAGQE